MPVLKEYDPGALAIRPTETGVEATAATARRVGAFSNQQAGATEMLARETERLAGEKKGLGRETQQFGAETGRLGSEQQQLGRETAQLGETEARGIADSGRRLGSAVEAAGNTAINYLDHQQIAAGAQSWARVLQNQTDNWNNISKNADPNDPTVAKKFLDQLDGDLQNFKDNGFYTEKARQWAENHVDALRQHFAEKTSADMATLAGHAAVVSQQQTVNSLSNTVHSDPSSLDFSLAALESTTEGKINTSPNLTGVEAAKVRSEILQKGKESIVKSAAIGYIEKTSTIPPWATDPKYAPYINGAELKMFESAAKTQAKTNQLRDRQSEIAARQLADQQVHATTNKIMSDNVSIDPQTSLPVINPKFFNDTLDMVRKNADAPSAGATARTLLNWGESQQNKTDHATDPVTKQDFTDRMFSADNPTTTVQLMKAQIEGKLSRSDFQSFHQLTTELSERPLKSPVWQATMAAVKDHLIVTVPGIPGKDNVGVQNYSAFVQNFIPQYLAKERAGTLEPNALDTKDPNSMIGKAMEQFKRSPGDRMKDYVAGAGGLGSTNLTGPGKDVISTTVENQPPKAPTERKAGETYPTPKGPMKWTGTGWVKP